MPARSWFRKMRTNAALGMRVLSGFSGPWPDTYTSLSTMMSGL